MQIYIPVYHVLNKDKALSLHCPDTTQYTPLFISVALHGHTHMSLSEMQIVHQPCLVDYACCCLIETYQILTTDSYSALRKQCWHVRKCL